MGLLRPLPLRLPPGAPPLPLVPAGSATYTTAPAAPAGSGQTVKVDLEVIAEAIKEYKNILEALKAAYKDGVVLTQVQGPGKEVPSQVYANAANEAGLKHQQANQNLQDTVQARIDMLEATLKQYQQTERGTAGDFNNL